MNLLYSSLSACWAFATSGGILAFLTGALGTVIMGISQASIYLGIILWMVQLGIAAYRVHIYYEDKPEAQFKSPIPSSIIDTNGQLYL